MVNVRIFVTYKQSVFDPQGETIKDAIHSLGHDEVTTVKVGKFFEPLTQSLNGGEFELQSLKMSGVLDTNVPFFMKGTTYNDTIVLCDEAEDLTQSQIRLIGTRLGENSKIYLAGDYKQSLLNKTINNPLIKMCNEFKGNEKFGCIYLGEDVRSETSKMFADLFEN